MKKYKSRSLSHFIQQPEWLTVFSFTKFVNFILKGIFFKKLYLMQNIVFFLTRPGFVNIYLLKSEVKLHVLLNESILLCLRFTKHLQIQAHD